jgi:hypothetical protein
MKPILSLFAMSELVLPATPGARDRRILLKSAGILGF